jgi:hypothetical protein
MRLQGSGRVAGRASERLSLIFLRSNAGHRVRRCVGMVILGYQADIAAEGGMVPSG